MIDIILQTVLSNTEIAIFREGIKIASSYQKSPQKSDNTFVFDLQQMMKQYAIKWTDIEHLWVVNGPGYFTGIRIGLAIAKAIFDVTRIPIRLVNTFHWLKTGVELPCETMVFFIPTSAKEGYVSFMKNDSLEEIRLIENQTLLLQTRVGYDPIKIYTNADGVASLDGVEHIHSFSHLPNVYQEVLEAKGIVPEYKKTEEDLFLPKMGHK